MAAVKRCVQCGLLKNIDEFRPYTYSNEKNTEGRYRLCRDCETLNTKYRRDLQYVEENAAAVQSGGGNPKIYADKAQFIARIETLYTMLESKGLRTPLSKAQAKKDNTTLAIEQLEKFYSAPQQTTVAISSTVQTPDELLQWLNESALDWAEMGFTPEYLQETVYESLKAKYRPQTGFDKTSFLPVYDDTFKEILNQILKKFDDYEESYSHEMSDDV